MFTAQNYNFTESGYKEIGRGAFSTAYRKGKQKQVLIKSCDPVKECMAHGWFPNTPLFPKVHFHPSLNDVYVMKYYPKCTAPKQQLNEKSYELYKKLRKTSDILHWGVFGKNIHRYPIFKNSLQECEVPYHITKHLTEAFETLINYHHDVRFEISPRNISFTPSGNLVLLDCFFLADKLKEARSK